MTFPHLNPGGITHHSPRPIPGGARTVYLSFDVGKLALVMRNRAGHLARTDGAILDAHHVMASDLQESIANVLIARVKATGRAQKGDQALVKAVLSKKNRDVKLSGYTVGYLGSRAEFKHVDPYFRGLEYGSNKFVGRFLRGHWRGPSGQTIRPIEGGKDLKFVQWRRYIAAKPNSRRAPHKSLYPGIRIRRAIKPYHYFKQGLTNFRSGGQYGKNAIDVYVATFYAHGFDVAGDIFRLASANSKSTKTVGTRSAPTAPGFVKGNI